MIWQEMTLVAQGELLWFDLRLIKLIDAGDDKPKGHLYLPVVQRRG
jgi:hypothetical protein